MVLYSWKKIYKKTKGNCTQVLRILKYVTYRPVPESRDDPDFELSRVNWAGENFLVNPEPLFTAKATKRELAEYVGLASFRNYAEYKTNRVTTLDLVKSPLSEDAINNNRLLKLEGDKIHFLFEEDANGEKNGSIQ